tara:strand:+ start:51 stop:338 length:288 start_codon:yes stop_codon:yes gene_type:complete
MKLTTSYNSPIVKQLKPNTMYSYTQLQLAISSYNLALEQIHQKTEELKTNTIPDQNTAKRLLREKAEYLAMRKAAQERLSAIDRSNEVIIKPLSA